MSHKECDINLFFIQEDQCEETKMSEPGQEKNVLIPESNTETGFGGKFFTHSFTHSLTHSLTANFNQSVAFTPSLSSTTSQDK